MFSVPSVCLAAGLCKNNLAVFHKTWWKRCSMGRGSFGADLHKGFFFTFYNIRTLGLGEGLQTPSALLVF